MGSEQLQFLEEHPKGIYQMMFLCRLDGEILNPSWKDGFKSKLSYLYSHPQEGYIQTPQEFFQRWLNGRLGTTPNLDNRCKGFELQIPEVRMNRSDDGSLVSGKIEGLVVASDFGYSGDFGDNLVFAINDIPSQRTLVYRDEDTANLKASPLAKKDLVSKRIYSFNRGQETYPFKSLNPLKSDYYTWSLVNFSTDEVYKALKEIGFDW